MNDKTLGRYEFRSHDDAYTNRMAAAKFLLILLYKLKITSADVYLFTLHAYVERNRE